MPIPAQFTWDEPPLDDQPEPTVQTEWSIALPGRRARHFDGGKTAEDAARDYAREHNGRVQRRTVTTTYGPWEDAPDA